MASSADASSPTHATYAHHHCHPDLSSEFSFFAKTPDLVFAAIRLRRWVDERFYPDHLSDPAPSGIALRAVVLLAHDTAIYIEN
jgi:hypothetical protein